MKTRLEVALALLPAVLNSMGNDFSWDDGEKLFHGVLVMADKLIALDHEMTKKEYEKTYFKEFSDNFDKTALQTEDTKRQ